MARFLLARLSSFLFPLRFLTFCIALLVLCLWMPGSTAYAKPDTPSPPSSSTTSATSTSTTTSTNPDALWVLGKTELDKRVAVEGTLLLNVAMDHAHALAVNPLTGAVWVFTADDALVHLTPAGSVDWTVPDILPLLTSLVGARLLPDPTDGSVWLVGLNDAIRVDATGKVIAHVNTLLPITAAALDTQRAQLWLATASAVQSYTASGTSLSSLSGVLPVLVTALSYAPVSDRLWVATVGQLFAYQASDDSQVFNVSLSGALHLTPDGAGGLWAANLQQVTYLDTSGHVQFTLSHPVSGHVVDLAANPSDHSVWVAGVHDLVRIDASGNAGVPIDMAGQQTPLAALGLFVDVVPPILAITAPANGALIANVRPPLTLTWSDQGSGVDPSTATFTDNQQPQAYTCQSTTTGATCVPASDLPQGVNSLSVTVKDHAGNTSQAATAWWRVDTIPPVITFTGTLTPGFLTNQAHSLLTGTLNESGSVSVNGTVIATDAQSFSEPVTLTEGTNTFTVSATDLAGNTRTVTLSGTLDTIPPPVPMSNDITVTVTNGQATLTGKAGAVQAGVTVVVTDQRSGQRVTTTADSTGAFVITLPALPGDTYAVAAQDAAGNVSDATDVSDDIPPDPATIAPPLPTTGTPPFTNRISFLYSGFNPIQQNVAPNTIVPDRAAVLTGQVEDTSGNPLPGVKITVLDHPEFGYTYSQASGNFDLAVNGGGQLTLVYTQQGYLPVQRHVQAPWQGWAHADPVAMTKLSTKVTAIDLTNSLLPFQVAQGEVEQDSDGTRQATMLFPAGEQATITLPDGALQTLPMLHVRATEFTVGPQGPAAMPGPLPPTTAYTYAVELSVDEASQGIEKDGQSVTFSEPVPVYVTNFLNFPVGQFVPVGYYDPDKAAWIPQHNGIILKILSIDNGQAQIDVTGAGTPATPDQLTALGITDAELTQLATLYPAGTSLWRWRVTHFTRYDANMQWGPARDAVAPVLPMIVIPSWLNQTRHAQDDTHCSGCDVDVQRQSMGETIPVAGTPFTLHYDSASAVSANTVAIPVTDATMATDATDVVMTLDIAGKHYVKDFSAAPNQSYRFFWDGKDAFGRQLQGEYPATIRISYFYPCVYYGIGGMASGTALQEDDGFGLFGSPVDVLGTRSRCGGFSLSRESKVILSTSTRFKSSVDNWSLSVDHRFQDGLLLRGDGNIRGLPTAVIHHLAGNGTTYADGVPVSMSQVANPEGIAVAPDGSIYYSEYSDVGNRSRVRRISPDGIVSTVAGTGPAGYSGDGGSATSANLSYPTAIAFGPDGSLYIVDADRIRKVTTNGIISTIAGTGVGGDTGDGGPAIAAELYNPYSIAVGHDGSVYIGSDGNQSIRKVTPDGIIHTIAGCRGSQCSTIQVGGAALIVDGSAAANIAWVDPRGLAIDPDGNLYVSDYLTRSVFRVGNDGNVKVIAGNRTHAWDEYCPAYANNVLAVGAKLCGQQGIAFGPDGNLYLSDAGNYRIARITPNGVLSTVVGTGGWGLGGDGGAATAAGVEMPWGIAVSPSNTLYFTDPSIDNIRDVAFDFVPQQGEQTVVSVDGSRRFVFDANGNILRTDDAATGAPLYTFQRNTDGQLLSVTDANGNVTTLERSADGTPTAIVAPDGQRTSFTTTSGQLTSVDDPTGAVWNMAYTSTGLMTHFTDRTDAVDNFNYDANGYLTSTLAYGGHGWTVVKTVLNDVLGDYQVGMTSGVGNTSTFVVKHPDATTRAYTNTAPDGTVTTQTTTDAGTTHTVNPDGSTESVVQGADPRFGLVAPTIASDVITTPAGLTHTLSETRTASVPLNADPTQPTSLTDNVTVNGHTTTSTYTGSSHTWVTTSPVGRTVTTVTNTIGQPLSVQAGSLAPVQNQYNAQGKLASITRSADGTTRTTTLNYFTSGAAQGYLQSVTGPLGLTVSYQRDANGRVTQLTRPDGQQVAFAYDAEGRLTSLTPPGGQASLFTYDGNGSRTGYTPPEVGSNPSATVYHDNADLQPTEIDRPDGTVVTLAYASGKLSTLTTPVGTTSYDYNPTTGQLAGITAPGGEALAYTHDGPLLTQVQWSGPVAGTVSAAYNNDFMATSQSVNGTAIPFSYDADDLLTQAGDMTITRATDVGHITGTTLNTVTTANTYDGYGDLASDSATASGNSLFNEVLTRDLAGRVTQKVVTDNGATTTWGYHYDNAGRLDYYTENGVTVFGYTYDANGNRVQKTTPTGTGSASITATYDAQDRLTTYGNSTYSYNAAGDLTSKTNTQGTTQYSYDALGNLRSVTLPAGNTITYLIDGQNRRVGKEVNGTLQYGLLYQNSLNPVAETDGSGNVIERFVYGDKANVPAYLIKGGTTYRIVSDYQGSVREVVNASTGQIVQQLTYSPFGQVTQDTSPGFQPFGYAGGLYDPDTSLDRFGARDYDPQTGRWTTRDPILFQGGQTNLYGYVMDDPVNGVDMTGQEGVGVAVAGAVVGAITGAVAGYITGGEKGAVVGGVSGAAIGVLVPELATDSVGAPAAGADVGVNVLVGVIAAGISDEVTKGKVSGEDLVAGGAIGLFPLLSGEAATAALGKDAPEIAGNVTSAITGVMSITAALVQHALDICPK